MNPMLARTGGLLVATGFTLALALGVAWATVVGAVMLVAGGLVLAIAAEPMLELGDPIPSGNDAVEPVEPGGGVAA